MFFQQNKFLLFSIYAKFSEKLTFLNVGILGRFAYVLNEWPASVEAHLGPCKTDKVRENTCSKNFEISWENRGRSRAWSRARAALDPPLENLRQFQ